ncbi:hypothetical protein ASPBRDRAFT_41647 [Aspergillus brasiliensis CBS 101740]|uniref:Uncharacterized protein n=1 Tax=Aspergillus brasiliensis (strain CBS 101740 / IMI 381727 / IBT 21946) TaxID=767769 RepID=A0A1L9UQ56_ASPBC|nr:hypothetical protein ASPBRDRAFT_41647 [Aspergillus brasiliensis CBS 101740]
MFTSPSPPQIRPEPTTHFYPSPSPSPSPPNLINHHHIAENHLDRCEKATTLSGTIHITIECPSSSSSSSSNEVKSAWSKYYFHNSDSVLLPP